jgi:cold-inducible RNA-binding protein
VNGAGARASTRFLEGEVPQVLLCCYQAPLDLAPSRESRVAHRHGLLTTSTSPFCAFHVSSALVDGPAFVIGIGNCPSGLAREKKTLNIYVGNLSFDTSERELEAAFATYGSVTSARIATDRDTNRPRGFGFVEMTNQAEAQAAIAGLNGKELQGRTLTVNEAKPREDRGQTNRRAGSSRW